MLRTLLSLSLLTFLAGVSYADIHKEIAVVPGKTLEMDLQTGGDVKISGWEKDLVSVDISFRDGDEERGRVDIDETASGVSVSSRYAGRWRRDDLGLRCEIRVPKKFNLNLSSKGGGMHISGVEGDLEGSTMGGALELTELKGTVRFHTMGGNITLTKSEVEGEVRTNGGKVSIEDVVGNVNGHTMGGTVTYRNVTDRGGTSTGDAEKITSMGGAINVSDAPNGADLSTMGGDIDVHSAANFVKAKTMGGDITIDKIDGWVRAETMGGDVTVTMTGDPSKGNRDATLTSNGGDITLTVPPGLSMEVDIRLAYTEGRWGGRKTYRIESDFDLKQERTKEWEDGDGSPRKYLYGTGTINGGKNKIQIRTINGNVYLKKGS